MSKIANVIFPYTPTNDDELELKVGDKIEVIGVEEEGWWRGKLKGREGVFPSNFVQVTETTSSAQQANNSNKLNSLFGSLVNTKNTISSNSLNNITSNNSNNNSLNNNNNNSTSSNNLIMNNTHPASLPSDEFRNADESSPLHSSSMTETTRPKPLRAMGYGDIFVAGAKTKPLPADPNAGPKTAVASERPNMANSLQRPIPKKPPPPAPASDIGSTNGSLSDQAPALPPKPGNSYVPFLQQRPLPQPGGVAGQRISGRKQARVIYAYTPSNSDELAMQVGDIIDVIDMDIEDQGWWKGELNGKIGVFPDNFVQLIVPEAAVPVPAPAQDWQNSSRLSGSAASNQSLNTSTTTSDQPNSTRIKSVFAGTPKGFSKELESNLEKHSNPASFLSLKRNKLQQQMSTVSSGLPSDTPPSPMETAATTASLIGPSNTTSDLSEQRQNGYTQSLLETSPGKLNHITANRAKGPARRPPKNLLNKRNHLNENSKTDSFESKDNQPPPLVGLPTLNPPQPPLPAVVVESKVTHPDVKSLATSPFVTQTASDPVSSLVTSKVQTSPSSNNHVNTSNDANQTIAPKTNLRAINQSPVIGLQQSQDSATKNKSTTSASASSTPPWMVELRKTNAEKKRDPPIPTASAAASVMEEPVVVTQSPAPIVAAAPVMAPSIVTTTAVPTTTPPISKTLTTTTTTTTNTKSESPAVSLTNLTDELTTAKFDSILKQISKDVHNEINELKSEVKQLREEFKGINELKEALEAMKVELKTCQSATDSQRRYIKDLVNNLADERKRIAAMQVEIDRNLK